MVLVFLVLHKNRNAIFPIPVAWAYWGIYQFLKSPEGFKGKFVLLQKVTLVGMAVLIGMAFIRFYFNRYGLFPKKPEND